MSAAHRYTLGRAERVRLWLGYQRYAFLLAGLALAICAVVAFWAAVWWVWLLAAVPVVKLLRFAGAVYGRWPRKLRATVLATRRIESGRFAARAVRGYCGDPCYRVVAGEILRRAGMDRRARRRLIRQFARELREPVFLIARNPDGSVTVRDAIGQPATTTRIDRASHRPGQTTGHRRVHLQGTTEPI